MAETAFANPVGAPAITRSNGVFVAGYNPGGGRSGRDPALDAVVAEAAERLRARYGMDVEIRFNSDRESGGAFLAGTATVGICAARRTFDDLARYARDYGTTTKDECLRLGLDPMGEDVQYPLRVNVSVEELRDPADANCNGSSPYAYLHATSLDDAMEILARICAR